MQNHNQTTSHKITVPLIKNAFIEEDETKRALADFIVHAKKLSMGEQCRAFEEAFAKKQSCKEAILFNSGGSANLAMFQALKNMGELKDGDTVGFSALTWSTNSMPIIQMGLKPVAIDCDADTLNVMSHNLEERHKQVKLKAFFATNVIGFAGDLQAIREFCRKNDILFLEDNCESLGTKLPEGKTGNFGLGASFSFYVAHHMSTIEGGMVCTDDEAFAEMLRIVRANGWDRNLHPHQQTKWRTTPAGIESEFYSKFLFHDLGFNLRPTEITGFLGLYQLQFLDRNIKMREQTFLRCEAIMQNNADLVPVRRDHLAMVSSFVIPVIAKTSELRDRYLQKFHNAGVEVRPMIAGNIQKQPFHKKYVVETYPLPNTDFLHTSSFYCGNCPDYTEEEIQTIMSCLSKN
ncbi:MAG: DegT/DnrJ/EryC1/StrS aminotransferase family protein [Candidatus Sungbacteria bacterium]|nr:DegT/DnrJ/EryC1/StrS aminotransferase family protein [Candidatus Sungbacteria bacterium]